MLLPKIPLNTAGTAALIAAQSSPIVGNHAKLAAKVRVNPQYKARILCIGDSMWDTTNGLVYLADRYLGTELIAGAQWGGQVTSLTGNVTEQWTAWPSGLVNRLSASNTSSTFGRSGNTAVYCSAIKVAYCAVAGAGTFSVEYSTSSSGPWTTLAASINADNGGAETGTVLTYTVPEGRYFVRVSRLAGNTDILTVGFETANLTGGYMWLARGGFDVDEFVQCPQSRVAPVVANFDPDIIIYDSADDPALLNADLVTYINKLQGSLSTRAGVILISRNSFASDTADAAQRAQSNALRDIATANGYGFLDTYAIFGGYTQANAQGYIHADGIHLSNSGIDLKYYSYARIWPSVMGAERVLAQPSRLVLTTQPVVSTTFMEAAMMHDTRSPVELGMATSTVTAGGVATRTGGELVVEISASVTSGSAKQKIRDFLLCGAGTGTGIPFASPLGFLIELYGRNFNSAIHRVFFGADAYDLTTSWGFGLEFTHTETRIICANGTTRTVTACPLLTSVTAGNLFSRGRLRLLVESDGAGNISVFNLTTNAGTKATKLVGSSTGGPTTTGLNADRAFMVTSSSTGVSNVNAASLRVTAAWIVA